MDLSRIVFPFSLAFPGALICSHVCRGQQKRAWMLHAGNIHIFYILRNVNSILSCDIDVYAKVDLLF